MIRSIPGGVRHGKSAKSRRNIRAMLKPLLIASSVVWFSSIAVAEDGYLQSDAGQYINTGYHVNPKSRVELDYSIPNFEDTSSYVQMRLIDNNPVAEGGVAASVRIAGTSGAGDYSLALAVGDKVKGGNLGDHWTKSYGDQRRYCDDARRTIVIDEIARKVSIKENGAEVWSHSQGGAAVVNTAPFPLGVFGRPTDADGYNSDQRARMRVYGLKIYEDNVLKHDFVPANKGGHLGLYDKIGGAFCYGRLSKRFTTGGDILKLEEDADPYLQNDGNRAINLRHHMTANTKIWLDFALTKTTPANARILGMDTAGTDKLAIFINDSNGFSAGVGDDTLTSVNTGITVDTLRHTCTITASPTSTSVQFGVGKQHWFSTDIPVTLSARATRPLALFGDTNDDYGMTFSQVAGARVYGCKIWDNGVLVHDYIPCLRGGVPGLKDNVDGAFITGEIVSGFTAGPTVTDEGDEGYVSTPGNDQAYGKRWLDTGYTLTSKSRVELDYALLSNYVKKQSGNGEWYLLAARGVFNGAGKAFSFYTTSTTFGWCCENSEWQGLSMLSPWSGKDVRRTVSMDAKNCKFMLMTAGYTNYVANITSLGNPSFKYSDKTLKIASYRDGTQNYTPLKIYGCRIYEDEKLVRNYVPYVKNGATGLLDSVDKGFITTPNSQLPVCPNGKIAANVEEPAYLESDGSQIVNTGYLMKPNARIEVEYALQANTTQVRIFGQDSESPNLYASMYVSNGKCWTFNIGDGFTATVGGSIDYYRHTAVVDATAKADGRKAYFVSGSGTDWFGDAVHESTKTATVAMGIFGTADAADWSTVRNRGVMKIYSLKVYEGDDLVHYYLPYKDATRIGFKDVVTGGVLEDYLKSATPFKICGYGFGDGNDIFYSKPESCTVPYGESVELKAFAPGAVAYQWYRDGEAVEGATDSTLTVEWTRVPKECVYTVKASFNRYGVTVEHESAPAVVQFGRPGMCILVR